MKVWFGRLLRGPPGRMRGESGPGERRVSLLIVQDIEVERRGIGGGYLGGLGQHQTRIRHQSKSCCAQVPWESSTPSSRRQSLLPFTLDSLHTHPIQFSAQRKDPARTQTHSNFAPRNTPAMSSDSWPQQLKCAHCRLSTSSAQLISISYSQRLGRQVLGADAGFEQRGSTG